MNSYKLAEKLQDRLNELNKDLTEMIEEINRTSQDLSKTGKPDDPVSWHLHLYVTKMRLIELVDQGRTRAQLAALAAPVDRPRRPAAGRQDCQSAQGDPAGRH
jgi:hypothetical protein